MKPQKALRTPREGDFMQKMDNRYLKKPFEWTRMQELAIRRTAGEPKLAIGDFFPNSGCSCIRCH